MFFGEIGEMSRKLLNLSTELAHFHIFIIVSGTQLRNVVLVSNIALMLDGPSSTINPPNITSQQIRLVTIQFIKKQNTSTTASKPTDQQRYVMCIIIPYTKCLIFCSTWVEVVMRI